MSVHAHIAGRRSIRKFLSVPVAQPDIVSVIAAARLAPSGKNRQPWHFTVLQGGSKARLTALLETSIQEQEAQGLNTGSAKWTVKVMQEAPVSIVIHNPHFTPEEDHNGFNRYRSLVDTQSIGAAIQNMLLTAHELSLGSLWICDIFYAERAINEFLGRQDELVATVSLGYAAENPEARPRLPLAEITTWLA